MVGGMSHLGSTPSQTGRRLAREWHHLRTRPDALLKAAGWGVVEGSICDLDQVLTAVGFETPRTPDVEQRLRRLVAIATDDELAARVLVQRLLPGLLAVVRRRRSGGYGDTAFDELLATLWISIRTYNPNRNPSCVAAALISDADYRAFRSAARRRSATERPVAIDDSTVAASHELCASDELAELFSEAIEAGIDRDDIEMLRQLVAAPRAIDLARQLNVTPRTIRNRRDRITDRLREVVLAA